MSKTKKKISKYPIEVYLDPSNSTPKDLPSRTIQYIRPDQSFFSDAFGVDFTKEPT